MNSESTLSDALSEVDTALAASDNERAAGLASELLLVYPNAVAVLRARARALAAAGRSLQAAEVHRRVLEILPADGEAMAGLARTLHFAGQHAEARDAARQALDYLPSDEMLRRIAAGEGQPFQHDEASLPLLKALVHTQVGLLNRGTAGLRSVVAQWPERTDAKIALMQALWRKGARIAAAEQAQAVLDDYPYCLNAHLLMLEMWRTAGASDMERVHLQAIEQVDPDHRVTHTMLGTQSPLLVKDVPARPAQPSEPAAAEEDPLAREAWVDSLVAASSALPKPLELPNEPDGASANTAADDSMAHAEAESDESSEFISSLLPLEWSAASDPSEESMREDFGVSWIDGNAKDTFSPARPRAAEPDPHDGVPEELPPLEWEGASDESAAQAQQDFRTTVDGGISSHVEAPIAEDNQPLKPLAAAGIVAAAVKRNDDALQDAGAATQDVQSQTIAESPAPAAAQTAPPESAPQQSPIEAQAVQVEVEATTVKPLPVGAMEAVDEDAARWNAEAGAGLNEGQPSVTQDVTVTAADEVAIQSADTQPAPAPEEPIANEVMPASEAASVAATKGAPVVAVPTGDTSGTALMKAVAAATALRVASKKRKPKADAEATAPAETQQVTLAPSDAAQEMTVPETVAPAALQTGAKKTPKAAPVKPKPAKKPTAKSSTLETQTDKVRKTYERAIATAKREDMPKLIKELNQAAERDPDNKIIFELLGQAYNRSGDIPAAISAYRKALELAEHS